MTEQVAAVPGRRALRRGPLAVIAVIVLGLAVLAYWVLRQPSPDVVFSVNAHTGVLQAAPLCNEELVWDLPAGRLMGRSAASDADLPEEVERVTVTLYGGASARLVHRHTGAIVITFDAGEADACPIELERRIVVRHGMQNLPADPVGYDYMSMPLEAIDDQPVFALPLIGRVVLGEDLPYGAGWSGATPLLQSGEYRARGARSGGSVDREQNTYLEEQLDAGIVVDTLPRAAHLTGSDPVSASGFVQIGSSWMQAQIYKRREISILTYAGVPTTYSVPRWRVLVRSTGAQILVALVAILGGIVGLVFSGLEALPNHGVSRAIRKFLREPEPPMPYPQLPPSPPRQSGEHP